MAKSGHIISELRALFGDDVVLLPIPRGTKRPAVKDWQNITVERMRDPNYLAQLNGHANIGVLLRPPLVTIDIDSDQAVEPFLALNPQLRRTLRSTRKRGCNFWLRMQGKYPNPCKLKLRSGKDWGEWRAKGNQTIIHGVALDRNKGETRSTRYRIEHRAQPIESTFGAIKWPEELVLPWEDKGLAVTGPQTLDELRKLYGQPYYFDKEGNISSLNQSFWAGLFAAENIILWEPTERSFYAYNPETGIYEETSIDVIKRCLSNRLLEASRQMNCPWLEKQRTDARLNSIAAHLRGIVERRGAFAHGQRRIHLANGVFSFDNGGELLDFSPGFVSRNRSPIVFDESAECPRFLNELVYPAMHKDDVALVQKYFGQSLLGTNLIQRFLILDGPTERGKTQLANVIQEVIGRENCTQLRTNWLADRFETFRFIKKTLLVGVDVPPDFLSTKGAAVLKGLVGGDWFDAEQKGGTGSFQFQGNFNAVVTSNARLHVRLSGDVGAWRRRSLIVRFKGPKLKKKIPNFAELLVREEGSGILNFAIAGLSMLLRDIDETGDIVVTRRQRTIVESLLAESDSLRFFLQEAVENADGMDVSVNEIVEAYAAFCPEKGWNPLPITEIHRSLEGLMLELFRVTKSHSIKRDGKSVRGFFGVRLK